MKVIYAYISSILNTYFPRYKNKAFFAQDRIQGISPIAQGVEPPSTKQLELQTVRDKGGILPIALS